MADKIRVYHAKGSNDCFLIRRRRNFNANKLVTKLMNVPTRLSGKETIWIDGRSLKARKTEAVIAGMAIRKVKEKPAGESSLASLTPKRVAPDREIAGIIAKA